MSISESSERIYLSPPDVGEEEIEAVVRALNSGWVAPLGPEVNAFEEEIAEYSGTKFAVALSSGTAALHLGLLGLGVQPGDDVLLPTMTFAATAFAVTYVGANPVFLDIENESWSLDPNILEMELVRRAAAGNLPAAVISVDLFGSPCNYQQIVELTARFEVPLLCDSAESLGAVVGSTRVGGFGQASIFSFNGNKIMTTSGGGILVTNDEKLASKVRYWSMQSREDLPWYEHREIGFNYRMSNILAALGRAQLRRLPKMIEKRRANRDHYIAQFYESDDLNVMMDPAWGLSNAWLSCIRISADLEYAPSRIRAVLESRNIESRPVWKPMHMQPVFEDAYRVLSGEAQQVFKESLCLPSGSRLTAEQINTVGSSVLEALAKEFN